MRVQQHLSDCDGTVGHPPVPIVWPFGTDGGDISDEFQTSCSGSCHIDTSLRIIDRGIVKGRIWDVLHHLSLLGIDGVHGFIFFNGRAGWGVGCETPSTRAIFCGFRGKGNFDHEGVWQVTPCAFDVDSMLPLMTCMILLMDVPANPPTQHTHLGCGWRRLPPVCERDNIMNMGRAARFLADLSHFFWFLSGLRVMLDMSPSFVIQWRCPLNTGIGRSTGIGTVSIGGPRSAVPDPHISLNLGVSCRWTDFQDMGRPFRSTAKRAKGGGRKREEGGLGGRGRGRVGREGLWLEGRALQLHWGDGGTLQRGAGTRPTFGGSRDFGAQPARLHCCTETVLAAHKPILAPSGTKTLPNYIAKRFWKGNFCWVMGSQHPSPNVKTLCHFKPNFGLKLSHHVMPKMLVLKAQRRHVCNHFIVFSTCFGRKISHHAMDASCWGNLIQKESTICNACGSMPQWICSDACRGKKSTHHHRGAPPFSVCRPTPRSQSKNICGVYPFPGKTREKGIHHRSGKKGIHTIEPQTLKKKKRRVSTVVVYTFFFPGMVSNQLRD